MTTVFSAVTEGGKAITPIRKKNGKLRVMCRYGGNIVSIPQTKSSCYVGGDTRIVAIPSSPETSFASIVSHLTGTLGISYDIKVKYQLPDQELDSLISVETDEDFQIMKEEHGFLSSESSIPQSRIRLFIFPLESQLNDAGVSQGDLARCKVETDDVDWLESKATCCELTQPVLEHSKMETWFVDAFKSVEMMQTGGSNSGSSGSGNGNGGICGQESMMLATNSSFGSTSSSLSSSKLPLIKTTGGDSIADSLVKFAPIESMTSANTAVTPISFHELLTCPPVLENKLASNIHEATLDKPVPIPAPTAGYPPYLHQAPQQSIQVIYTGQPYIPGNSPMTSPPTLYHHPNHIHYQIPPQPYAVYYIPVEQYSSSHLQVPLLKPDTHQVNPPVVRTNSPLAPPEAKPVDSFIQTSNEASTCRDGLIYNSDFDDNEIARAQIYKSQPPAPFSLNHYA